MGAVFSTSMPYLLIGFFVFLLSVQQHFTSFKGASKTFYNIMSAVVTICSLGVIGFLIYWGVVSNSWWMPIVFGLGGIAVASFIQGLIARLMPQYVLTIISMIVAPILLITLFISIQ